MTTSIINQDINHQIAFGRKALHELKLLVKLRPNPVVINGKRYLEFVDYQMLGAFFGISSRVTGVEEITQEARNGDHTFIETAGFRAHAEAYRYNTTTSEREVLSEVYAECMMDEPNWGATSRSGLRQFFGAIRRELMEKSREQVETLKLNWRTDPCWDIEDTEGFEQYREELLSYRTEQEARWDAARIKHHDKLLSMACPLSFVWVDYGKDDRGHTWRNCLVEKCAWWNVAEDCCVIRALTMK